MKKYYRLRCYITMLPFVLLFMSACNKGSIKELTLTGNSIKANLMDDYTPEQIVAAGSQFQSVTLWGGTLGPGDELNKLVVWEVGRNAFNLWKVESNEELTLKKVAVPGANLEWRIIGFNHTGSLLISNTPVVLGSWTQTLAQHSPSNFSTPASAVIARVVGNYAYGSMLPVQLDNYCSISLVQN